MLRVSNHFPSNHHEVGRFGLVMEIRCVAVIGAGTMGAGIAQVCAQSGWKTHLFDAFPEGLERGMQRIDAFWDKGIAMITGLMDELEALKN